MEHLPVTAPTSWQAQTILLLCLIGPTLALAGCGHIQVALGLRTSLKKTPVASIAVSQYRNPGIGPGKKSSLIVDVREPTGTVLVTEGKGKGKVLWSDLAVKAVVVTVNKKGVISLPQDPRLSQGKTGHITVTVPSHPGIQADLDIPLRYNYKFVANYSGSSGSSGSNGTDGTAGSSGTNGSTDPDNPSPGGAGGNGTNGTDGSNGGDGSDGPDVHIFLTLLPGDHPLLQAGITSSDSKKELFFLVDPQGGTLTVTDSGGAGGSGGKGGRGGSGGSGGSGSPPGSSGTSGTNGNDGSRGRDGNGGPITVTYDPAVQPYLSTLHLSNPGGTKPVFQQRTVAPLW
jgi:hypothetical protein